jgi:hypothetical protein
MAKKYEYTQAYTESDVSSKSFDRKADFLKPTRAAEGESTGAKYPDYAGGKSDRRKPADPDLDYVNSGKDSGSKSWN